MYIPIFVLLVCVGGGGSMDGAYALNKPKLRLQRSPEMRSPWGVSDEHRIVGSHEIIATSL